MIEHTSNPDTATALLMTVAASFIVGFRWDDVALGSLVFCGLTFVNVLARGLVALHHQIVQARVDATRAELLGETKDASYEHGYRQGWEKGTGRKWDNKTQG